MSYHDKEEKGKNNKCAPYPYPGYYYPLQCLGYAYIPWQVLNDTFPPAKALYKGTLFPELYSPYFLGKRPPVVPTPYLDYGQRKRDRRS